MFIAYSKHLYQKVSKNMADKLAVTIHCPAAGACLLNLQNCKLQLHKSFVNISQSFAAVEYIYSKNGNMSILLRLVKS